MREEEASSGSEGAKILDSPVPSGSRVDWRGDDASFNVLLHNGETDAEIHKPRSVHTRRLQVWDSTQQSGIPLRERRYSLLGSDGRIRSSVLFIFMESD